MTANESGRPVYSSNKFMPFISKKSVTVMALHVLAGASGSKENLDLASMICVCAYAGYFLQEILLSKGSNETGFESVLHARAFEFFATARAWMTKLLESQHTRLAELQALTFGVCYIMFGSWSYILISVIVHARSRSRRYPCSPCGTESLQ